MYKARGRVVDFPYYGYFYDMVQPDLSVPLDHREIREALVYESECDIQEVSKAANPVLIATFSIFMPFDIDKPIPIRSGMSFKCDLNGMHIHGMITNVVLSQVGGLVAYVKDYDSREGA